MSDMIAIPSSVTIETMAINPAILENMIVPTPPDVIASRVENMIIGGFTEESRPKAP
jgi:hypothetical protein